MLRAILTRYTRRRRRPGAMMLTPEPTTDYDRASLAYAALQQHFASGVLFREQAPATLLDRRYAYLWPFSQAWAAALDLATLGASAALAQAQQLRAGFFDHYWDHTLQPPGGAAYPVTDGGGDHYYDDNAWIGLVLVELAALTGDAALLIDAARVCDFVLSGWDTAARHPAPGGIFWTLDARNPTHDRNTCVNAPTAMLALRLHAATGEQHYLDWGQRLCAWVDQTLRDPADGLYWDRIQLDGGIERTKWSYNQGTMLGATALLGTALGDAALLARAGQIADAALARYATDDRLWRQDAPFNAIFFRNLHLLGTLDGHHERYLPLLRAYTDRIWSVGRDPASGLCHFGRSGRPTLLWHAAAVQLFALRARIDV